MLRRIAFFATLSVLSATAARGLQIVEKTFGNATITFALPPDQNEVTGGDAIQRERRNVPPSNEFIARFDSSDPFIYTTLQGFLPTKQATLSPADFLAARQAIHAEVDKLSPETNRLLRELEQKAGADYRASQGGVANITLSRPVVFDIFDESERHISFLLFLTVVTTAPDGRSLQTHVSAAMSCALLQGKVVYVYFFRPFLGLATYDQLRETCRISLRETLARNP